ncbi:MAG: hypothetical protein FH761_19205 [Firmicutes bacterium]|nr:hypothetical protein [Bacillota bacterium]
MNKINTKDYIVLIAVWVINIAIKLYLDVAYWYYVDYFELLAFFISIALYTFILIYYLEYKYKKLILMYAILFSIWTIYWPISGYHLFNHLMAYSGISAIVTAVLNYLYIRNKNNVVNLLSKNLLIASFIGIGYVAIFVIILYIFV